MTRAKNWYSRQIAPNVRNPRDIVMPGHIFPAYGTRWWRTNSCRSHTEAGCDVARLAGLEASSVIVEILNKDGSMARRPQLEIFAENAWFKLGTIADLIEYRTQRGKPYRTCMRKEPRLCTEYGIFNSTYRDTIDSQLHYAYIKENKVIHCETLMRAYRNALKDILHAGATQWSLQSAIEACSC